MFLEPFLTFRTVWTVQRRWKPENHPETWGGTAAWTVIFETKSKDTAQKNLERILQHEPHPEEHDFRIVGYRLDREERT